MRQKNPKNGVQQARILYIGTTEQIAKMAPVKGLEPPIFLTDAYPGFFCQQSCKNNEKWGIISVNQDELYPEMLAPFPNFIDKNNRNKNKPIEKRLQEILDKISIHKDKWQKSLTNCGVCLYIGEIFPNMIKKVMIYNNIHNTIDIIDPISLSPAEHKAAYQKNLEIAKWLNGEDIDSEKFSNRKGLDLFYTKD